MLGEEGFKQFYRANLKLSEHDYQRFLDTIATPLPRTFRMLDYHRDIDATLVPLLLDAGFIYSQEVVSMLPLRFMQLSPDHLVLDMCAAPGSKTTQMAQHVRLLVSNEASAKRCNVLVTNLKKTPSANVVVTNQDACSFPMINLPSAACEPFLLLFDRILCDVPCSSDGTIRKDKKILEKWHVNTSLFRLQVKILKRAAKLLKPEGFIVYSTCTFSPLENEAVVQAFCDECAFEIVDCSAIFDLSIKRIGLSGHYEDENAGDAAVLPDGIYKVAAEQVTKVARQFVFREGLTEWDPFIEKTKDTQAFFPKNNTELRRCLRVMPQDQDTGGFFIALLRRRTTCDMGIGKSVVRVSKFQEASNNQMENFDVVEKKFEVWEHPHPRFQLVDDVLSSRIRDYYGLKTTDVLVTESKIIRSASPLAFLVSRCPRLKVISVGVKAFEKNNFSVEKTSSYRISYEYAQLMWRTIGRVVHTSKDEFKAMMEGFCPIKAHIEGCVVFECEGFVCPGFVNNGKGMFFMNKQIKEVVRRIL
jgi:16S rRNA C967 or C1407 C5-methylase (RsmB/RsmF family)